MSQTRAFCVLLYQNYATKEGALLRNRTFYNLSIYSLQEQIIVIKKGYTMNTKLLLACVILYPFSSYSMKRKLEHKKHHQRPHVIDAHEFNYADLPLDLKLVIFDFMINNSSERKPRGALQTVNALYRTNKLFYQLINEEEFQKNLINNFANKFYCSHETIAYNLRTHKARDCLYLQYQLKNLCLFGSDINIRHRLNRLLANKIDLTFTYNHNTSVQPAIMIAAKNNNLAFNALLPLVDLHAQTPHGLTLLQMVTTYRIALNPIKTILKMPTLDVNQTNRRGETALLRCLIQREKVKPTSRFNTTFIKTVDKLLKAGADPEKPNNNGLRPLTVAYDLGNQEIIDLIQNAIHRKQT